MTDFAKSVLESLPEADRQRLQDSERFLRMKDQSDLVKSWENSQAIVGKVQADRYIEKPGKNATPEQWADFFAAGGRPEKPEDYKFSIPEGANKEAIDAMRPKFHELGLSNQQVEAAVAFMVEQGLGAAEQQQAQQALLSEERKSKTIKKMSLDYGERYEKLISFAQGEVAKAIGDDADVTAELRERYEQDPIVLRLAIELTKHNAPDALHVSTSGSESNIAADEQSIETKLAAKRKEYAGNSKGYMNDPTVKELRKQLTNLRKSA